ncbi:DUF1178 family protein [Desulfobacterales bacterium HSG2]|nr:DUF1178 family protein [Desulfobacterales bacterium HSG2]
MIVFDLQCNNGHVFEGWFEDGHDCEQQMENALIACPICDDTSVSRIPSTFAIKSSQPVSDFSAQKLDPSSVARRIMEYVDKNFDDVGCDFAREALKIHYGASEPRNIKGTSTETEEKTLQQEGIEFFKIPMPKQSDTDA